VHVCLSSSVAIRLPIEQECYRLVGSSNVVCCVNQQIEPTDEQIDIERLKVRDRINYYSDIMLFEDELHDSGCSVLSVKIVSL
jgi:hypothetical protein